MYRKIAQYDLQGHLIKEWDNYSDIYFEKGFFESNIRNCIRGVLAKAYGYKWQYNYYD